MKELTSILGLLDKTFAGEWGSPPDSCRDVVVFRSTNFGRDSRLDLSDVVLRCIDPVVLTKKRLKPGDILLEKSGGGPQQPVGRVVYFDEALEAVCSNFIQVCRPDLRNEPRFVFYLFDHLYRSGVTLQFQQQTTGLTNLKLAEFLSAKVRKVAREEQQIISQVLWASDRAIQQTEALLAKQQRIKTGLMHDLLTRGLDAQGRLRDTSTHRFKKSLLGLIPEEWEVKLVEQAGSVTVGRQRAPVFEKGLYMTPYLRVANVFDGWIDFTDVLSMNFDPADRARYELLCGDVLLNEGQSLELVGRSAIYNGPPATYCFQNTLIRFRCRLGNNPVFAQSVFKRWLDTGAFQLVAKQTTSVAHLGATRFAKMPFPLPPPDEQNRIAVVFEHEISRTLQSSHLLTKLRRLKTGLMHDLLTGERSVTPLLAKKTE